MNDKEDILEEMKTVWQEHSKRIDQIAAQHDVSKIRLVPRVLVLSSRKQQVVTSVMTAVLCLSALAAMVILRRYYIVDIFDFILIVLLSLPLIIAVVHSVTQVVRLTLQSYPLEQRYLKNPVSLRYTLSRTAVLASLSILLIFLIVPVPNGRAMSGATFAQRAAVVNNVTLVLTQMQ